MVINMNLLRKYLLSPDSIFDVDTLEDFIESLHILGFHRGCFPEVDEENLHLCYRFLNPRFIPFEPVPEDLYKVQSNLGNQVLKLTKRMVGIGSVKLLQKLIRKKTCSEVRISRSEFAKMKLKFALKKALYQNQCQPLLDVIEFNMEEPEYTKNNEIAGYYGNVSIDDLKKGFQNFFPVFQESQDNEEQKVLQQKNQEETVVETPQEASSETEIQSAEPDKKKRKYTKKAREDVKETQEALLFLQKESLVEPDQQWIEPMEE